jgi:hypothetical protein
MFLETESKANEYCILNDRTKGDNRSPTYESSKYHSTTDYIIIPRLHFSNIHRLDILAKSCETFNTDHNVIQISVKRACQGAPPQDEIPTGLTADAVIFLKFALIDQDVRHSFQIKLDDLLSPYIDHGFNAVLAPLRLSTTKQHQALALSTALMDIMRKAATKSLGTRPKTRRLPLPRPPWWKTQMSSLTATQRSLTRHIAILRKKTSVTSTLILNAEAELTRTQRLLRVTGRKLHRRHNDSYYETISRTIHKNRSQPKASNKPAWNLVQARRDHTHSRGRESWH